jgi:hypothetical protein
MGIHLKIGDIFEVKLSKSKKCFFQFIGFDQPQLNSEVIRVFKKRYTVSAVVELDNIVEDEVQLYAHTYSVSRGQKEGLWKRIGNTTKIGDPNSIIFNDWLGIKTDPPNFWHIWHMNGSLKQIKNADKRLQGSHPGSTFLNNEHVVEWIKKDTYPGFYPDYKI